MITAIFLLFIFICTLVALTNWRRGLFLMLLVGVLQDPVRKLTPGAPAIMVLCFLPVWLAAIGPLFLKNRVFWTLFKRAHPVIGSRIKLFCLTLIPAVFLLLTYDGGAWKLALIGVFGYLAPLMTMVGGFSFARHPRQLQKLLVFYCLLTSVMMVGSVLEYLNLMPDWPALVTAALGMEWIRHVSYGHMIHLMAGFYRSPDVMGWHASALVMFSLTMALGRGGRHRWLWVALALWGAVCLLISGRNKMILMPVVWASVVAAVHVYLGRAGRTVPMVLAGGLVILGVFFASGELGVEEDYFLYISVGSSSVAQRVEAHGWDSVLETYRQSGFLGKGMGTASQGVQYLGIGIKRSWQEGGLDKLMVELGVPGLIAALLLVWALFKALFGTIRRTAAYPSFPLHVGLLGFLAANASSFIVSHQAYSDGLIVTFTSFFIGVALAGEQWLQGSHPQCAS